MSDPESPGAETTAAEAVNTPSAPTNPDLPPSTFGNNRGSGLARGKRPVSAPQAATAAPAAEYKPTAVSILTAPTEYKNPFAPPAPPAPPAAAPAAEVNVPAPAPAAEVPAPSPAPVDEVRAPVSEPAPEPTAEVESKPELKILPPETQKRVEHNWESQSFRSVAGEARSEPGRPADAPDGGGRPRREDRRDDRRDDRRGDRPVFRPDRERRNDRPAEVRPEGESSRSTNGEFRRPEPFVPTQPKAPQKTGGFFGWLKKLFGGPAAAPETPPAETQGDREFGRDGQRYQRRHRGGRGRNFRGDQRGSRDSQGGPRDGQGGGQPSGEQRGPGGDGFNNGRRRRRRHRGGGGYRGEGGFRGDSGYRGGPRPEGGPPSGS